MFVLFVFLLGGEARIFACSLGRFFPKNLGDLFGVNKFGSEFSVRILGNHSEKVTRWAFASCKWNYNPYKWLYKWVTGVITPSNTKIYLPQ